MVGKFPRQGTLRDRTAARYLPCRRPGLGSGVGPGRGPSPAVRRCRRGGRSSQIVEHRRALSCGSVIYMLGQREFAAKKMGVGAKMTSARRLRVTYTRGRAIYKLQNRLTGTLFCIVVIWV